MSRFASRSSLFAALAALAAACGGKAHPSTGGAATGACPSADRVAVAVYLNHVPDVAESPASDGWRLYLKNTSNDGENEGELEASYASISLDELRAAGVTPPTTVWLSEAGKPPCKATVTGGFREVQNVGPVSTQLGVELTGCPAPSDEIRQTFALIGDEDLSGCRLETISKIAERGGNETGDSWAPSTDRTELPEQIAKLLPAHDCESPACERLWFATQTADGKVASVIRTWLKPMPDEPYCSWPHDDEVTVLVDSGHGLAPMAWPADSWARALTAVFSDGNGPRLLVLENTGYFDVYTVGPDGATRTRDVKWFDPNEEDSNYYSQAPYCGP